MKDKPEYIICAAVWFHDIITHEDQPENVTSGVVVAGRRHHNCYATYTALTGLCINFPKNIHGFITSKDRFVERAEAYTIAKEQGQLLHDMHDEENLILISEDLY